MTLNTKALLLSAFAFPGLGQFFLKRKKSAVLFIGLSLISTVVIIHDLVDRASVIVNKVIIGEIPAEYTVIRELLLEKHSPVSKICLYVLIFTWILCVIDILRLRKKAK